MLLDEIKDKETKIENENIELLNIKEKLQKKIDVIKDKFSNEENKEFCNIIFKAPSANKYDFNDTNIVINKYKIIKQEIITKNVKQMINKNVSLFIFSTNIKMFKNKFDEIILILNNIKSIMEE